MSEHCNLLKMSSDNNRDTDVSDVILQVNNNSESNQNEINSCRQPKRILHFSDGDLIEYSDEDETDSKNPQNNRDIVDPRTLDWMSWTWHQTASLGTKVLNGCDYVGEALADFLGITSPKYLFELNEYKRLQKLEAEEKSRELQQMESWNSNNNNNQNTVVLNDIKRGD